MPINLLSNFIGGQHGETTEDGQEINYEIRRLLDSKDAIKTKTKQLSLLTASSQRNRVKQISPKQNTSQTWANN
jgi:hypothetical protein